LRVLIIGKDTMLGHAVLSYFTEKTSYDIYATDFNSFDPTIDGNNKILGVNPDYVINCLTMIPQQYDDSYKVQMIHINTLFPITMANYCQDKKWRMIHPSTDCVFSGKKGLYLESSEHDATSLYGRTKSLGEPNNCMVLRTSLLGPEINSNYELMSWLFKQKECQGYCNHYWNGVTTYEFARICHKIIKDNLYKRDIFHIYSEDISKYELLKKIEDRFNLDVEITPIYKEVSIDRRLRSNKFLMNLLGVRDIDPMLYDIDYKWKGI
jgi:dTDP-4-dehydrorhamnose reductase